jgi:hypothetical protein
MAPPPKCDKFLTSHEQLPHTPINYQTRM